MIEIIADVIIPFLAVLAAGIGGAITIFIYYRNSQLQRAQWLYSLYDRFFYQSNYSEIRRLVDYGSRRELNRLRKAMQDHSQQQLEEKIVDYLNFFEFIASLWRLQQLPLREIRMMFDYYIRRLGDHDFLMEYLREEGFEGLRLLVQEVRKRRELE